MPNGSNSSGLQYSRRCIVAVPCCWFYVSTRFVYIGTAAAATATGPVFKPPMGVGSMTGSPNTLGPPARQPIACRTHPADTTPTDMNQAWPQEGVTTTTGMHTNQCPALCPNLLTMRTSEQALGRGLVLPSVCVCVHQCDCYSMAIRNM